MKSAVINKTSEYGEITELLTGTWNDYDEGDWHITRTPFFLVLTGVLDAGSHALPFTFDRPVPALLCNADNTVTATIIKPGDTAVNVQKPCSMQVQVFGAMANVKR